ncbi:hypothetical protein ACFONG_13625 [Uliginosibacterium paludis]|uniref:Lipoprotein n=1 Tax=Uliginosibacterium paludis TaxID=1615952 RepID=A0ABV2CPM1_9RHOO
MKPIAPLLIALALLLSAGCAPTPVKVPDYVAPPEGPASAKIQVRSPALAGNGFLHVFDDGALCTGPHQLASSATATKAFNASSRLKAGEPSTLLFHYRNVAKKHCRVAMTFVPEAGRNYLATAFANEATSCGFILFDITDPTELKPVKRRALRTLIPAKDQGAYCRKADLEAEFAKAARPNRSNMKMSDLADILPPEPAK